MLHPHNGYWISGSAVPGPPYTTYWTPCGYVLWQRPNGSLEESTRLVIDDFEVEDADVAAWFGLELARMIVDN